MIESVREKLINVLDRNFGYTDEEPAEKVADRIMRAGIIREEKPVAWNFLFNALDGTPRYGCPICKGLEWRKTPYCPNCGADMREENDEKA